MNQTKIREIFIQLCNERSQLQARIFEINKALHANAEQCTHSNRKQPTTMTYDITCPDCGDRIYCWAF